MLAVFLLLVGFGMIGYGAFLQTINEIKNS